MKFSRNCHCKGEGGFGIWIILLALLAGGLWFLYSSRAEAERKAREFAEQVVQTLAVKYDVRFLTNHMSPQAQVNHIPSLRDRNAGVLMGFCPVAESCAA